MRNEREQRAGLTDLSDPDAGVRRCLDSIRINVLGEGSGDCARPSGPGEVEAGWV
jgi:hypothetical protein